MQKRNATRPRTRTAATAGAIQLNWQHLVVVLVCGIVLAAGFFFAARQHFMSMDYGFKNSKLKKQLEDLESEKRRLILAREVSLSPTAIRKAAQKAAAVRAAATVQNAAASGSDADRAVQPKAIQIKADVAAGGTNGAKVVRTAYVRPTDGATVDANAKTETARDKRDGFEIAAVAALR